MLSLLSVHFDNRIPNWRTNLMLLNHNVLVLMIEGKIKYTINDRTVIGEKGELLFLPINTLRTGENHEGEHQKFTVLFNHSEEDSEELPIFRKGQFIKCKIRNFEYFKHRFEKLYLEVIGDGKFNRYLVSGILQELVGMAAREFELVEAAPIKLKLANELQKYMVAHYRQPVQIDELASLIHRSSNYTISMFREVMGVSPIQYIHLLRMKEACNLLTNSDLSISEISNYLGYYDHSYFFRIFKKYTSMSPTAYKLSGVYPPSLQLF
ncbi:AraC family transcriptional regulator [Paenibacillus chondroitinus]|uniref:AraC family transcriptional regulator n=1 Tax=Paenibacillus chondroitinus TaxID=59842 RepID=A0ABU6DCX8_9BACL|nr:MULTISPECIES: AraC family transcriptional regulator [Paenibacillus]MCY9662245.1 AraC family transcriptional regulator [Paenibacillus anseongense]MEB4794717.1 AraC family transcriptional regulator [Paenibacillus chondroitinus]